MRRRRPGRRSSWSARLLPLLICSLVPLLLPVTARGYKRAEVSGVADRYLYWPKRTLGYSVNKQGCKDVSLQETLGAVKRAFFAWASPSCTDIYFNYGGLSDATRSNLVLGQADKPDGSNLIVWHTSWPPPGAPGGGLTKDMPAVTTVIYNTQSGVILDADIDLNSQDFFWTTFDDTSQAATDIQNILTHEIGHLLGLTHSTTKEATMYEATFQSELDKRTLHADDQLGVCTIYPFGKTTPTGAGQGSVPQDVQGGCAVTGPSAPPSAAPLLLLLGLVALGARVRAAGWARRRSPAPPRRRPGPRPRRPRALR